MYTKKNPYLVQISRNMKAVATGVFKNVNGQTYDVIGKDGDTMLLFSPDGQVIVAKHVGKGYWGSGDYYRLVDDKEKKVKQWVNRGKTKIL